MPTQHKSDKPAISDAEIARIRAAAHRYLLAGGAIYLTNTDTDLDEHIATIRLRQRPQAETAFACARSYLAKAAPRRS